MTLYMSKWRLRPEIASDAYETHRGIWEAFEDKKDDKERKFLYMTLKNGEAISISRDKPLNHADIVSVKKIDPVFHAGKRYRFVTCANPCRQISATGKRMGILDDQGIMDWLQSKFEGTAKILEGRIRKKEFRVGRKKQMKFWTADVEGVIECVDPKALRTLIENGYGKERGMGCGMLLPYAEVPAETESEAKILRD